MNAIAPIKILQRAVSYFGVSNLIFERPMSIGLDQRHCAGVADFVIVFFFFFYGQ
jgi:hypothetical protein